MWRSFPEDRLEAQALSSMCAGYGLNQPSWPSDVIQILPGMPI